MIDVLFHLLKMAVSRSVRPILIGLLLVFGIVLSNVAAQQLGRSIFGPNFMLVKKKQSVQVKKNRFIKSSLWSTLVFTARNLTNHPPYFIQLVFIIFQKDFNSPQGSGSFLSNCSDVFFFDPSSSNLIHSTKFIWNLEDAKHCLWSLWHRTRIFEKT